MEKVSRIGAEKQKFYSLVGLPPNKKLLDQQVGPNFVSSFSKVFLILGFSVQGMATGKPE